jgi:Glycosyl hydrolase family 1
MFLKSFLTQLQRATADGVPAKGCFHWSIMDNFEWMAGYGNRFGMAFVDFDTLQRIRLLTAQATLAWNAAVLDNQQPRAEGGGASEPGHPSAAPHQARRVCKPAPTAVLRARRSPTTREETHPISHSDASRPRDERALFARGRGPPTSGACRRCARLARQTGRRRRRVMPVDAWTRVIEPFFYAALAGRQVNAEVTWFGGSKADDKPFENGARGRVFAGMAPWAKPKASSSVSVFGSAAIAPFMFGTLTLPPTGAYTLHQGYDLTILHVGDKTVVQLTAHAGGSMHPGETIEFAPEDFRTSPGGDGLLHHKGPPADENHFETSVWVSLSTLRFRFTATLRELRSRLSPWLTRP